MLQLFINVKINAKYKISQDQLFHGNEYIQD